MPRVNNIEKNMNSQPPSETSAPVHGYMTRSRFPNITVDYTAIDTHSLTGIYES